MAPMVSTIEIARPPAEVFAVATDPLRFAEWQRDVVEVRMLDGSRFATTRRVGGAERRLVQQIVRNDPPDHWAARGIDGPIRPTATITVESIDGGRRSRVTFTLEFEGHGIGRPLVPLVRRQAEKGAPVSYQNLQNGRLSDLRSSGICVDVWRMRRRTSTSNSCAGPCAYRCPRRASCRSWRARCMSSSSSRTPGSVIAQFCRG